MSKSLPTRPLTWPRTLPRTLVTCALLLASLWAASPLTGLAQSIRVDEPDERAQQDAGEEPQAQADPVARPAKNLLSTLKEGGLLMIPLFACSVLTLVFVFERAISLRRGRVIPTPFVKRFMHQLREGKLDKDQALDLCQTSQTAISDVFAGAARKWGRPAVEVEQAILDAGERAANGLRKYIRIFSIVASVSPLLGLLGTVFGMIHIFGEIATADAMGRTGLLAGGISEAMVTTASGLSVAIPALVFHSIFVSRIDRLVMEIDALGQELVNQISAEALQEDRARSSRASRRGTAA